MGGEIKTKEFREKFMNLPEDTIRHLIGFRDDQKLIKPLRERQKKTSSVLRKLTSFAFVVGVFSSISGAILYTDSYNKASQAEKLELNLKELNLPQIDKKKTETEIVALKEKSSKERQKGGLVGAFGIFLAAGSYFLGTQYDNIATRKRRKIAWKIYQEQQHIRQRN